MPLKGGSSFPGEEETQTWSRLQVQEKPSRAGSVQGGLEMLCELSAAGSWAGRKEQPARTWWVGKIIMNLFLFLLITLFTSSLFDCRFELSSFQKERK